MCSRGFRHSGLIHTTMTTKTPYCCLRSAHLCLATNTCSFTLCSGPSTLPPATTLFMSQLCPIAPRTGISGKTEVQFHRTDHPSLLEHLGHVRAGRLGMGRVRLLRGSLSTTTMPQSRPCEGPQQAKGSFKEAHLQVGNLAFTDYDLDMGEIQGTSNSQTNPGRWRCF